MGKGKLTLMGRKPKRKKFVVVVDGQTSTPCDSTMPENFSSFDKARQRACVLARAMPGDTIEIYKLTAGVACPVGEPELIEPK